MSKFLLSVFVVSGVSLFSGCTSIPGLGSSTPAAVEHAAPAVAAPASASQNLTAAAEICVKLAAALKACDQTGGMLISVCKSGAKMKYDCPTVEQYMR